MQFKRKKEPTGVLQKCYVKGSLVDKIPLIIPAPSFTQKCINLCCPIEIINYYVNLCSLAYRVVSRKSLLHCWYSIPTNLYIFLLSCWRNIFYLFLILSLETDLYFVFLFIYFLPLNKVSYFHKGNIKQPNNRLSFFSVQFTDFWIVEIIRVYFHETFWERDEDSPK